jgi:hypothetical protein
VAKKKVKLAAKALLENGPSNARRGWLVKELRSLSKWKMNLEEFLAQKVSSSSIEKLLQLWESQKDNDVADIVVPPEIEEANEWILELHEMEVGRAASRNVQLAIKCVDKISDSELKDAILKLQQEIESRENQLQQQTETGEIQAAEV